MNIKKHFNNDLLIGIFGGTLFGAIIAGYAYKDALNESEETVNSARITMKEIEEQTSHLQGVLNELNAEMESYIKEMAEKDKVYEELKKKHGILAKEVNEYREKEEVEKKKEKVRKAIKEKQWDDVYRWTERWYNHYPVQMSRAEVFSNLKEEGYITQEERTEAYNYFGSLWNYVGD